MRHFVSLAALSLAVAVAVPARAQASAAAAPSNQGVADSAATPAPQAAPAPAAGAPMTGLRAGVHARESAVTHQPTAAAAQRGNMGRAGAMMIVGAAAFVAGAIIEGDVGTIFMVGGAVIGLYGLYKWLQ